MQKVLFFPYILKLQLLLGKFVIMLFPSDIDSLFTVTNNIWHFSWAELVEWGKLKTCLVQNSAGTEDQSNKKISFFHQELEETLKMKMNHGVL